MYGGNLNDVELYKGACIITKIAYMYVAQCSLDLDHMVEISMMLNCVREHVYITKIVCAMQCS